MIGAGGSLVTTKPHSEIINDLIRVMKQEYAAFLKANESLSKGDYLSFLSNFKDEYRLLEKAGKEIRILEQRAVGHLNSLQQRLKGYKKKAGGNKNMEALIKLIDRFLKATYDIEGAIRTGTHVSIRQEGTVKGLTRK